MTFFGKNIKHLRESKGLDHKELGDLIGIPAKQISHFEDGFSEPDFETLIQISNSLEISIDKLLKRDLSAPLDPKGKQTYRLLVLDIDGVLTDGGMYYSESGDQIKKFNAKDGRAITMLLGAGIEVAWISGANQPKILSARAAELGVIHIFGGVKNKLDKITELSNSLKIRPENIACIGDDLNDLQMMEFCGLSACPADAVRPVKEKATVVLNLKGGEGCVREFVDKYILGRKPAGNQENSK